jgi:hypothetical protein
METMHRMGIALLARLSRATAAFATEESGARCPPKQLRKIAGVDW